MNEILGATESFDVDASENDDPNPFDQSGGSMVMGGGKGTAIAGDPVPGDQDTEIERSALDLCYEDL